MANILNQRPVKNNKELSIENNSVSLGRRQVNVINWPCLGCGVDAISWMFAIWNGSSEKRGEGGRGGGGGRGGASVQTSDV